MKLDQELSTIIDKIECILAKLREMLLYFNEFLNEEANASKIILIEEELIQHQTYLDRFNIEMISAKKLKKKNLRVILLSMRIYVNAIIGGNRLVEVIQSMDGIEIDEEYKNILASINHIIIEMLDKLVTAFKNNDKKLAREVIEIDRKIDHFKEENINWALDEMMSGKLDSDKGVKYSLAFSSLERIGDRISNIAEDFFYIFTGKDIRQSPVNQ